MNDRGLREPEAESRHVSDTIPFADNCPLAPPAQTTVYTRVLHRACEILGGVPQLAGQLNVSVRSLQSWLDGEEQPPTGVFLACVDIALSSASRRRRNKH